MNKKYFVLGLPRTGTTSLCVASLDIGLKTAHTAYTQHTLQTAEFIADTPVFNDYTQLHEKFPDAKYIYLEREHELWIPSIRRLLLRMLPKLANQSGGFNDTLKRCYFNVFPELSEEKIHCDEYLIECYNRHKKRVSTFFEDSRVGHISINLSDSLSCETFSQFMSAPMVNIPHLNKKGKVTAWNDIKHPLKIESTRIGKVDKDVSLYDFCN
ncbi:MULTISPECIES: sulfotransferase [Pseudoalteromonas]|uniref:Sulfotransferase n=1 Tax=Pseudoalteromonas obscura TaxID=3048491 RepID=A0ABT7EE20_9GAMM|nr:MULTISPECIES: sulfotransferase [Pseudoalteromonas]MBQ4836493.1 sulfotransferase family protein [Pseudoalteromonas luteoviolacea]MDK2593517.1 sulfotransferase [Pseudoalteromonas sp. P94(2023)]